MVVILLLMTEWLKNQKLRLLLWMAAFLVGILVGFKAYTGMLVLIGFVGMLLVHIVKNRAYWITGPLILAGGLFLYLTFPQVSAGASTFILEPGWFLKTMMEAPDRLANPRWELLRQTYIYQENTLRIIELWTKAFLFFFVGNMGVRILGLGIIRRSKHIKYSQLKLMLGLVAATGLIMPLLFLQKGIVWNTIQFFYVTLFVMNIFTAVFFARVKNNKLKSLLLVAIILLSLPTTIRTLSQYRSMYRSEESYQLINHQELAVLRVLSERREGNVLAPYNHNAYVSGISGQVNYFSDDVQANLLGLDVSRKQMVEKIFCGEMNAANLKVFLAEKQISYVYLPKTKNTDCKPVYFDDLPYLTQIEGNESAVLYKYD